MLREITGGVVKLPRVGNCTRRSGNGSVGHFVGYSQAKSCLVFAKACVFLLSNEDHRGRTMKSSNSREGLMVLERNDFSTIP